MSNMTMFNSRIVREGRIPSANGHMTARAITKFYHNLHKVIGENGYETCFKVI